MLIHKEKENIPMLERTSQIKSHSKRNQIILVSNF